MDEEKTEETKHVCTFYEGGPKPYDGGVYVEEFCPECGATRQGRKLD